jgi:uncharacterized protein (TIGR00290 family)
MYAIASSGGKDSTFALYHAQKNNFTITHLFHIYNPDTARVRFHGYRPSLISEQAKSMGLKSIIMPTRTEEFDEDFKIALQKVKQLGLKGIVFGNISLSDVREFYETRVKCTGLEYHDLLWGLPNRTILHDFIKSGFKAVITSVWLKKLDRSYLGREIDEEFVRDVQKEEGVDICGENGEYHSLVYNGPCFVKPLNYRICGIHEEMENIFLDVR